MNTTDRNMIQQDVPPSSQPPKKTGEHRGPGLWPFVLIGLGLLFLLENFGVRTFGVWNALAVWWPLVLIALGADLITRQLAWGRQFTFGLVIVVALFIIFWSISRPAMMIGNLTQETVNIPITASRAEIQIGTGVGRLEVEANRTGKLIDGRLDLRQNERLEREDSKRGDAQFVRLETKSAGPSMVWPGRDFGSDATWKLALAPNIPIVLRLSTGVGESRIDLANLKVTDLTLNTGIGRTSLVLPSTGAVRAQVDSGIGETNIRIPTGMDTRIRASSGIGAVTVNGNYQRDGETYTSPGFSSASNRIELEVKGGIGRVSVDPGR